MSQRAAPPPPSPASQARHRRLGPDRSVRSRATWPPEGGKRKRKRRFVLSSRRYLSLPSAPISHPHGSGGKGNKPRSLIARRPTSPYVYLDFYCMGRVRLGGGPVLIREGRESHIYKEAATEKISTWETFDSFSPPPHPPLHVGFLSPLSLLGEEDCRPAEAVTRRPRVQVHGSGIDFETRQPEARKSVAIFFQFEFVQKRRRFTSPPFALHTFVVVMACAT